MENVCELTLSKASSKSSTLDSSSCIRCKLSVGPVIWLADPEVRQVPLPCDRVGMAGGRLDWVTSLRDPRSWDPERCVPKGRDPCGWDLGTLLLLLLGLDERIVLLFSSVDLLLRRLWCGRVELAVTPSVWIFPILTDLWFRSVSEKNIFHYFLRYWYILISVTANRKCSPRSAKMFSSAHWIHVQTIKWTRGISLLNKHEASLFKHKHEYHITAHISALQL